MANLLVDQLEDRKKELVAAYLAQSELDEYQQLLETTGRAFLRGASFTPGELVMWKPNMQTHAIPSYDKPMVYLGMKKQNEDEGDLLAEAYVGVLDGDLDFVVLDVQVARLTRFRPSH